MASITLFARQYLRNITSVILCNTMAARSSKHRCFVSAFALLALLLFAFPAEGKKKGAKKSSGKKGDEALCEACKALSMEIGPKASKLVKKLGKGEHSSPSYLSLGSIICYAHSLSWHDY